ncbi:MAG: prepilin-type N-terminal cleavage/methylation domain-containing protein [Bdellovibrionales bacterium]|nr:prepilin-type N-terminal cleavage/methylation domain-containing protein [Bdellovibrionales bacterium]
MAKRPKVKTHGDLKALLSNQSGFTLMEIMIAVMVFTTFATVFVTSFGYNLVDSGKLKEDILIKDLCENKINELVTNPPTFTDTLTLSKDTKDIDKYPDYQTIVEWKKFATPDMSKIAGNPEGADADEQSQKAQMEKRIYNVFKENMEKMIWQVEVTVKNKITGETFKLDAWIYNPNADVKIGTI